MLDLAREYNTGYGKNRSENADLQARIETFELAYRMQMEAPEAIDLSNETEQTKTLRDRPRQHLWNEMPDGATIYRAWCAIRAGLYQ